MDQETKENYIRSGEVVQEARRIVREEAEPGTNIKEIAEAAEQHIRDSGLKPAFPVNTSINEEAAHYTPTSDEKTVLKEEMF